MTDYRDKILLINQQAALLPTLSGENAGEWLQKIQQFHQLITNQAPELGSTFYQHISSKISTFDKITWYELVKSSTLKTAIADLQELLKQLQYPTSTEPTTYVVGTSDHDWAVKITKSPPRVWGYHYNGKLNESPLVKSLEKAELKFYQYECDSRELIFAPKPGYTDEAIKNSDEVLDATMGTRMTTMIGFMHSLDLIEGGKPKNLTDIFDDTTEIDFTQELRNENINIIDYIDIPMGIRAAYDTIFTPTILAKIKKQEHDFDEFASLINGMRVKSGQHKNAQGLFEVLKVVVIMNEIPFRSFSRGYAVSQDSNQQREAIRRLYEALSKWYIIRSVS